MAHAIGVKGQHDKEASSEGGAYVMEAEVEIGFEWWVHSGNLVTIYNLEVTVALTNESDLVEYIYSVLYP